MKVLYFDCETTGLDYTKNGIVQLSGVVEIDGEVKEEFNYFVKPPLSMVVDPAALAVSGITLEQIAGFDDYYHTWLKFIKLLEFYINKFDRQDKFYPAGYNATFDYPFLQRLFAEVNDQYFGSYFNHKILDPFRIVHVFEYAGLISLPDYKLGTVCNHYGINIKAHDAMSDIKATRELLHRFLTIFKTNNAQAAKEDVLQNNIL